MTDDRRAKAEARTKEWIAENKDGWLSDMQDSPGFHHIIADLILSVQEEEEADHRAELEAAQICTIYRNAEVRRVVLEWAWPEACRHDLLRRLGLEKS